MVLTCSLDFSPEAAICVVPGAPISLLPDWASPGQHHTEPSGFRKSTEGRPGKGRPAASHQASPSCPAPDQATHADFFETASSQPAPSASHVPLQSRGVQDRSPKPPAGGQAKPLALPIPPRQESSSGKRRNSLVRLLSGLFLFYYVTCFPFQHIECNCDQRIFVISWTCEKSFGLGVKRLSSMALCT